MNYSEFRHKFDKNRSVYRFDFLFEHIEELFLIQDRGRKITFLHCVVKDLFGVSSTIIRNKRD